PSTLFGPLPDPCSDTGRAGFAAGAAQIPLRAITPSAARALGHRLLHDGAARMSRETGRSGSRLLLILRGCRFMPACAAARLVSVVRAGPARHSPSPVAPAACASLFSAADAARPLDLCLEALAVVAMPLAGQ